MRYNESSGELFRLNRSGNLNCIILNKYKSHEISENTLKKSGNLIVYLKNFLSFLISSGPSGSVRHFQWIIMSSKIGKGTLKIL